MKELFSLKKCSFTLILLHSERPKLCTILAFLSALELKLHYYFHQMLVGWLFLGLTAL